MSAGLHDRKRMLEAHRSRGGPDVRIRTRPSASLHAAVVAAALVTIAGAARAAREATDAPAPACDPAQGRVEGAIPWVDQTEADWIYGVTTRFADVDGHRVHYPTPTAELAAQLAARAEPDALRHLADARLALGDRAGAIEAIRRWGAARGPWAWADVAAWAEEHRELALALDAATRAIPCIAPDARKRLADERVVWADAHPELADPVAMRRARAELFPDDGRALESWVRSLEAAGRLEEADRAIAASHALTPERLLIVRADLAVAHHDERRAFEILDAAVDADGWSFTFRRHFSEKTTLARPELPEAWRATLDARFDPRALVRLATYFQGAGRGLDTAELLRQVERRHAERFGRADWLLLARLESEIDAVPEAFRARLSAARLGTVDEQLGDLAALARLALDAGSRPLPWGVYNDEPYRWVARLDTTPGFLTGGVSFLLTGGDWKEALANLEGQSLGERTFATARALVDELARRAPAHGEIPALRVAIMQRHVDRGEGQAALAIFSALEPTAPAAVADAARRVALLAMRQVESPLAEEARLYRERLRALAPDGTRPSLADSGESTWRDAELVPPEEPEVDESRIEIATWGRASMNPQPESYRKLLDEAIARLDDRDASHRTTVGLLLGELDRLPDAEDLWLALVKRLDGWNLDDDLGPRYERALKRFRGPGWWSRLARWYARRSRHQDLRVLADDLVNQFRGASIFARADLNASGTGLVALEIPEQPRWGDRVRLVRWADWVRLRALERFPHSPRVVSEARARLRLANDGSRDPAPSATGVASPVVADALVHEREWALLFVDPTRRESWFADAMRAGNLAARLEAIEKRPNRTPVEDQLLAEGWARLSHFERASAPADRVAAAYPSDSVAVHRALSLHRSLQALEPGHAERASAVVETSVAAVADANAVLTELGEMEEERGRPHAAAVVWRRILELDPRDPKRVEELATLFWDYEHMAEALEIVEDGRKRLAQPRLLAFEAGVLREELRDLDGAVREYLAALDTRDAEMADRFPYSTVSDDRAVRRIATLLGRTRPRAAVLAALARLRAGEKADEEALVAFLPLLDVAPPYESAEDREFLDWLVDREELPHDPVARAEREAQRDARRPTERAGAVEVGAAILTRALDLANEATSTEFLDTLKRWRDRLLDARWAGAREVAFDDALAARRAALATTDVERVNREIERATALLEQGQREKADRVWADLLPRIEALPEGGAPIRAWVARAGYVEKTAGVEAAARAWAEIGERYPWSLGVLDDRLAFLTRVGMAADSRAVLAAAAERAALGHREALLERLAGACLDARDLACVEAASRRLVESEWSELDESRRVAAFRSLARARFALAPETDGLALVTEQAKRFAPASLPDLYAEGARAADGEHAGTTSVTLWIEALNRRTERAWIREAMRAAERAQASDKLLAFFERQQSRSARDVRWAVVVRELRLAKGDLEGAIAASKAAVQVRPENRELWVETADLLERAGRAQEAADYLAGRDAIEPGNEDVARRRGVLYARAANATGTPAAITAAGQRIVALERAALAAFKRQRPLDDERRAELTRREARAVRRLLELGYPREAWVFLAGSADKVASVRRSGLGLNEQAELALRAGKLVRYLNEPGVDDEARLAAAQVIASSANPEQKEEVFAAILGKRVTFESGRLARASEVALAQWWPFAREAALEDELRLTLARKLASGVPGPWQSATPFSFAQNVAEHVVVRTETTPWIVLPDLEASWVEDLVNRDQPVALAEFLAPRVRELMARVRALGAPLPGDRPFRWTAWLEGSTAFETWCRGLVARPDLVHEIEDAFTDVGRWSRFLELGAKHWSHPRLVALLSPEARDAWFRVAGAFGVDWANDSVPNPVSPATREAVAKALGNLATAAAGATTDPLLARLRGPRTVGEAIGDDPRFEWPEVKPTETSPGVAARRDTLRFPRDLWGDRPGEAWYALEALARLRDRDANAWRVPLEVPDRGGEAERDRVARELALATGDPALALTVEAAHRAGAPSSADIAWRVGTLVAAGRPEEARATIRAAVTKQQSKLRPDAFRALRRLALDLGLPDPVTALDPGQPVDPSLLAYLADAVDLEVVRRWKPVDVISFRSALASRWCDREAELSKEAVEVWLDELWAPGSASLPRAGLVKLGGLWPAAADWLASQSEARRAAALAAVRALPADVAPLTALLPKDASQRDEATRLFLARVFLARNEAPAALALFDGVLHDAAVGNAAPSVASAATTSVGTEYEEEEATEDGESGGAGESDYEEATEDEEPATEAAASVATDDATIQRLHRWLDAFRDAKQSGGADVLPEAEARTLAMLLDRESRDASTLADWPLALELARTPDARSEVLARLERAWIRGDLVAYQLGSVVAALARVAPEQAPRWLARWPLAFDEAQAAERAELIARLGDRAAADALLSTARSRGAWSAADEVRAFDAWRRLPAEKACDRKVETCAPPATARVPKSWTLAATFWREPASKVGDDLARHLGAHPFDLLAARAALRTVTPLAAEVAARATATLRDRTMQSFDSAGTDTDLLRIRAMRGLLPASWRAADSVLSYVDPRQVVIDFTRRRMRAADIDASLADLARLHAEDDDAAATEVVLQVVEERSAASGATLRRELAAIRKRPAVPKPYRFENGAPRPYRPRDLDWALVEAAAEAGAPLSAAGVAAGSEVSR
ncbi:MAG: hypothetical protein U0610_28205 [bacterium]